MRVPYSWLKAYVDIDCSAYAVAEKLSASGFEVEEVIDLSKTISNIVVGQITAIERHPNADKLQICKLDCGAHGRDIQIITAAKNVAVGNYVPVALDGAKTANGMEIKKTQMRGEDSFGMLCSGEELGITEEWFTGAGVDGILILENALPHELKEQTYPVVGGYNYLFSKLGHPVQSLVGLDDFIFEIAIPANRPDCQSIYGIAREVAAIFKATLFDFDTDYNAVAESVENAPTLVIKENALALCPQYLGKILKNVQDKSAPKWMQRRLALCGMRAKNAAVDITNYVLLELGQPLHAFNLDAVAQNVVVRCANEGEVVTLLNEKEVTLTERQLVIADNEKVLAVAGIMGAKSSAISADTKNIFLECAVFDRANIRRSSKALAMRTDASARYEKGIDSFSSGVAFERALHLFDSLQVATIVESTTAVTDIEQSKKLTGCEDLQESLNILPATEFGGFTGIISGYEGNGFKNSLRMVDNMFGYWQGTESVVVRTSYRKINSLLGLKLASKDIKDILERLDFIVYEVECDKELGNIDYKLVGNRLECTQILVVAPLYRTDIEGYADLAEEVIRVLGYEHIVGTMLTGAKHTAGGRNSAQKLSQIIKNTFVKQGYQEAMAYSFISPKDFDLFGMTDEIEEGVRIQNPLGEDFSLMRTSLAPSMLQMLVTNIRKNNSEARLFEAAKVYKKNGEKMPFENDTIAIGVYGATESFYTAKGAFEAFAKKFGLKFIYRAVKYSFLHHGRSAEVLYNGRVIGYVGEVAPTIAEELSIECPVYIGELYLHKLYASLSLEKTFTKLAKYSDMYRDISLLVPKDMTCGEIEAIIYSTDKTIKKVALFDTYFDEKLGEDKKSLAFTITFENAEIERKPEEIDSIMHQVAVNLQEQLGIVRR